ncbi:MAG: hypothetical protein JKY53_04115 [Flavobacteriales bacterium]|nr:hypothetical protein [Flavobacteriales bacterium]
MDIFKSIFQNIAVSFCLFTIALLVWSLDKGFDLSDEGYYLMCLKFPSEYFAANQWGNSILGSVFGWLNPGIIFYRVVRLISTVLSSVYLAHHLSKLIKAQITNRESGISIIIVFAVVFSGAVLSYSIYPTTISYNSITVILLQLIVGQIICIINTSTPKRAAINASFFGLGVLLMMLFVAKISTGIFMSFLILVTINFRSVLLKPSYRVFLTEISFMLIGAVIFSIILSFIDRPIFSRFELILEELKLRTGEKMAGYISGYYVSLSDSLARIRMKAFWVPLLLFCVGLLSKKNNSRSQLILQTSIILTSLGYIIYLAIKEDYFSNMYTMLNPYIMILLAAIGLVAGAIVANFPKNLEEVNKKKIARLIFGLGILFIIPIIGTIGTNNPLTIQAILFLFSWSSLVLLLLLIFTELTGNRIGLYIMLMSVFVIATLQLYIGMVEHPYRISQPLDKLSKKLPRQNVYVDDKTYNCVNEITNLLKQKIVLEDNHPMLDINTLPGLVYILNGKSPGVIWSRKSINSWRSQRLAQTPMLGLEKLILFVPKSGISKNYVSILNEKGVLYPQNYSSIGEVKHPLYNYKLSIMVPNSLLR